MVKEFGDEVLAVGFFSEENPETATRIAKTIEDYERRHYHITGYNTCCYHKTLILCWKIALFLVGFACHLNSVLLYCLLTRSERVKSLIN